MNNLTEEQQDYVEQFFKNYPDEEIYDDLEKCNLAVNAMASAVREIRKEAIAKRSIALLEKARTLDGELTQVFMLLQQRHQMKALQSGIQLASPNDLNGQRWRK